MPVDSSWSNGPVCSMSSMRDAPRSGPTSSSRKHDFSSRPAGAHPDPSPSRVIRYAVTAAILLLMAGFVVLGIWQVERRAWKLALIERVEERVHAAPSVAPSRAQWADIEPADAEYRRVRVAGHFLEDRATRVQALTEYGSGSWVIVPLRLDDGEVVLVNRGFSARPGPAVAPRDVPGEPTVMTGLLRISEPHGSVLQANDPVRDRWYSRDVEAIAMARGLERVLPYFIDADAATGERSSDDVPIGGLTVIAFRNHHLLYAITWFVLASLCAGAVWRLVRTRR